MLQLALGVIFALVVIGVVLWLVNQYLAKWMAPPIVNLMNVAVVVIVAICLVFYLANVFGLLPLAGGPPVPKLR